MKSIKMVLIALITATTFIVFSIHAYFTLFHFNDFTSEQIKENLVNQAEKEAHKIDMPIRDNANAAAHLAALVGSMKEYNEEIAFDFMKKIIVKNDLFSGMSLAFEPGAVSSEKNFYLAYIYKDENNKANVDWSYNGAQYFDKSWYKLGMSTTQRIDISKPYQDNMGIVWISVVSPIIRDGKAIGVASTDMIIDSLREYVFQLKVGEKGYAYLIAPDGTYLGKEKDRGKDLTKKIAEEPDQEIKSMEQIVFQADEPGFIELKKDKKFIAYAPVGETGFKLVLVYMEDEMLSVLRQALLTNGIGFMITIIAYIMILTFFINRRLVNPLTQLADIANQVARGNLTPLQMDYKHNDEIGLVYNEFHEMILALKEAHRDIAIYLDSLGAKNAELERFTYTVSHDLRSPLITIKGFAGMITKEIGRGRYDRVPTDLRRIENAADKMTELLNGLLELSRIGRIANVSETINMTEVAKQTVELLHEGIRAKDIQVEIQENMPDVLGDKTRIGEVIQNLVENAVKFMNRKNGKIAIGCLIKEEEYIFFVSDNGPGIDPEYHDKIFGLFDKLDSSAEGSGIGLALVKRIIEYHEGQIWVESNLGSGANFFFTIKGVEK